MYTLSVDAATRFTVKSLEFRTFDTFEAGEEAFMNVRYYGADADVKANFDRMIVTLHGPRGNELASETLHFG